MNDRGRRLAGAVVGAAGGSVIWTVGRSIALLFALVLATACASDPGKAVPSDALIIDVRTPQEYASGHVKGAVNIPYEQIGRRIGEVTSDREKDIALYCRSGRRSGIAKATLDEMGFTNVVNVGGLSEARAKLEK